MNGEPVIDKKKKKKNRLNSEIQKSEVFVKKSFDFQEGWGMHFWGELRCGWGVSLIAQSFLLTNSTTFSENIFNIFIYFILMGRRNVCKWGLFVSVHVGLWVWVVCVWCVCVSVPTPEHELHFVFATLLVWEMCYALAGQRCDIETMRLHQTRLAKPLQRRYKTNNKAVK